MGFLTSHICDLLTPTTAQQEAQRAQFLVEKAKQEQRQKIVQAEGEAEAAKMISFCWRDLSSPLRHIAFPSSLVLPHGLADETKANAIPCSLGGRVLKWDLKS